MLCPLRRNRNRTQLHCKHTSYRPQMIAYFAVGIWLFVPVFKGEIICSTDLHHHETQHNHCPSPTSGCCRAHTYCPANDKCDIICHGDGCTRAHIHATNALDLTIVTNNNWCRHISIFCPLRDDINFIFKGDHTLHNASIHTLRGFSNIYIEPTCESCCVHCGATGIEHNCTANTQATDCIDDDDDCKHTSYREAM
eukprot:262670_1